MSQHTFLINFRKHLNLKTSALSMVRDDELSSRTLTDRLQRTFRVRFCTSTVRKARRYIGWTSAKPKYCQLVRHVNKRKRLRFALKCWRDREQFDDVIFTDESMVQAHQSARRCFRKEGHGHKLKPKPKHPVKVYVWAGISKRGKTNIFIFDGRLDSIGYQHILYTALVPFINRKYSNSHRFMQDSDPKHTSRSTRAWMLNREINHWPTPPESPDMNPIENIWAEMKHFLSKRIKPRTKDELVYGIRTFWASVTIDKCCRYISHLRKVIPMVIKGRGAATGF